MPLIKAQPSSERSKFKQVKASFLAVGPDLSYDGWQVPPVVKKFDPPAVFGIGRHPIETSTITLDHFERVPCSIFYLKGLGQKRR